MDKIKVETTGDFMLLDLTNGQTIEANRETEVEHTAFVDQQIARGRLKTNAKLEAEPRNPGSDVEPVADKESVPSALRTDDKARVANATGEPEPTEAELDEDRASPMGGVRKRGK